MVEQTQSRTNHTSYRKFNFNEFVANVLRDNMVMLFLTFEVVEAVLGQKHHTWAHTLALNVRFIPQRLFCLPKIHQEMRSVMTFSLHSASISRILEPSPQGLISSIIYRGGYLSSRNKRLWRKVCSHLFFLESIYLISLSLAMIINIPDNRITTRFYYA